MCIRDRYHGGNISPGMQMRFKALNQFTGRLPLIDSNGRKLPLGRDTETAIRAGVLKRCIRDRFDSELAVSGRLQKLRIEPSGAS